MEWYKLIAVLSLVVCFVSSAFHLVRLIRLGRPTDFSKKSGNISKAIQYSFTGAMSPVKKESAFLHLPTYSAGVIFHLGTFLSILLFFLFFFEVTFSSPMNILFALFLSISGFCGIGILIKRIVTAKLRSLSNPDDYISNILVTVFQFLTALVIAFSIWIPTYYTLSALLLLYFPIGKLKHAIYFFAARYHLGLFFGWRGVWPPV